MPQQQQSAPPSSQRVLTLSVPRGQERHLTSSDIKKLTWEEYICLYEVIHLPLPSFPPPVITLDSSVCRDQRQVHGRSETCCLLRLPHVLSHCSVVGGNMLYRGCTRVELGFSWMPGD